MTIFKNIDVINKSNLSVFQMKIHLKGLNESNMLESLVLIKIVSCATLVLCLVEIYIELLKFFSVLFYLIVHNKWIKDWHHFRNLLISLI